MISSTNKKCIFCLVTLLFIRKSSRASVQNELGDLKVNDFVVAPEIEDKLIELSEQVNESENDNRPWNFDFGSPFITNYKLHENIKSFYEYHNKVFQVAILLFFGISCDWKKIQTIFRSPIGHAIPVFCRWIYAPLVSETLLIFRWYYSWLDYLSF